MNRGAIRLGKIVRERGEQTRLAEELGIDQGYISRLVNAERVPGLKVRRLLEEKCSIRMQWWDEEVDVRRTGTDHG